MSVEEKVATNAADIRNLKEGNEVIFQKLDKVTDELHDTNRMLATHASLPSRVNALEKAVGILTVGLPIDTLLVVVALTALGLKFGGVIPW